MNKFFLYTLIVILGILNVDSAKAQNFSEFSYESPKSYRIAHIRVEASYNTNQDAIIAKSGLKVGEMITIPGQQISSAIKKLWEGDFFADVQIYAETIKGSDVTLLIKLVELEKWSGKIKYHPNLSKKEADDIKELTGFYTNKPITKDD